MGGPPGIARRARRGRDDAGPLPTAALEGLMAASASAYDLELISSKAQVYRAWGVQASNPWTEQ